MVSEKWLDLVSQRGVNFAVHMDLFFDVFGTFKYPGFLRGWGEAESFQL